MTKRTEEKPLTESERKEVREAIRKYCLRRMAEEQAK